MRTALVTGASTGIGANICSALLDDGYSVVNVSRRPSVLVHPQLHNYSVDLSDSTATKEIAAQIIEKGADYVLALKGNHRFLRNIALPT